MSGTDQTELTVTHATEIFQPISSPNERPNVHVRVVEAPPKYTSYEEEAQKPGRETDSFEGTEHIPTQKQRLTPSVVSEAELSYFTINEEESKWPQVLTEVIPGTSCNNTIKEAKTVLSLEEQDNYYTGYTCT